MATAGTWEITFSLPFGIHCANLSRFALSFMITIL